jgi:hypothetical protein
MYILGVDIPLVELILAVGVIGIIILLEITIILLMITYHMKNSKKLELEIAKLVDALTILNQQEFRELQKIKSLGEQELTLTDKLRHIRKNVEKRNLKGKR